MILSHQHRFIFFKVVKTAGTSLEIALSRFCGPDDVITPISPEDEELRARLGFRGPQNWMLPRVHARGPKRRFFNHMSAARVKSMVDPWVWNTYYKFCFVRNPWDRIISQYWWRYRGNGPSFSEFIASKKARGLHTKGLRFCTIDGAVVVDDVLPLRRSARSAGQDSGQACPPGSISAPQGQGTLPERSASVLGSVQQGRR